MLGKIYRPHYFTKFKNGYFLEIKYDTPYTLLNNPNKKNNLAFNVNYISPDNTVDATEEYLELRFENIPTKYHVNLNCTGEGIKKDGNLRFHLKRPEIESKNDILVLKFPFAVRRNPNVAYCKITLYSKDKNKEKTVKANIFSDDLNIVDNKKGSKVFINNDNSLFIEVESPIPVKFYNNDNGVIEECTTITQKEKENKK